MRGSRFDYAALAAALLAGSVGSSYLKWRREKSEERAELKKSPANLLLEKEYAPQDCYGLTGRVALPPGAGPVLAAAFEHGGGGHELVGSREVIAATGYYGILLPNRTYDLVFFSDRNGILSDPAALDELAGVLDATTGPAPPPGAR